MKPHKIFNLMIDSLQLVPDPVKTSSLDYNILTSLTDTDVEQSCAYNILVRVSPFILSDIVCRKIQLQQSMEAKAPVMDNCYCSLRNIHATAMRFARKLDTGDKNCDWPIVPGPMRVCNFTSFGFVLNDILVGAVGIWTRTECLWFPQP